MITLNEAISVVNENISAKIKRYCLFNNLYLFVVEFDDELEGNMDCFYSVHTRTKVFKEFPFVLPENLGPASDALIKRGVDL